MKEPRFQLLLLTARLTAILGIALFCGFFWQVQEAEAEEPPVYTLNAVPIEQEDMPGVYVVKAKPGDSKDGADPATIGIPSISKQFLADFPTTESPAIIMGAAVNYETKPGLQSLLPSKEQI